MKKADSPKVPIDLRAMFGAAEAFRDTSRHIYATIPTPHVFRFLPSHAVLSSLSLEIYLKCLVLLAGKSYGGTHDLLEIFNLLDEATQRRICELYMPHYERAQAIVDAHHRELGRDGEPPEATVEFTLNSCRRAFENFRYFYEPGKFRSGEGWSGDAIVGCARTAILERKPEWAEMDPQRQPIFIGSVPL